MHWPLAAALWAAINAAFLWAGMLVYIAAHSNFRKTLRRRSAGRAFLLAPVLFLPAYAATFVITNLLWYPGLGVNWRALAPLAEIVDLRLWADALRVPYLVALLGALWRAIPQPAGRDARQPAESAPGELPAQSGALALASGFDLFTASRFLTFTVAAGLVNAMIGSFLLLRLPEAHAPSLSSLCVRAALYVAAGALAGVAGSWFYWNNPSSPFREKSPLPFPLFALVCAAAWVWVPCMVLFSEQVSAATAFVAMAGALVLASGLRSATRGVFAPAPQARSLWEYNNTELFAESLYRPPWDVRGYAMAIALYAAGWALATHSNYTAALLLASSAFLFTWERAAPRELPWEARSEYRRSARRLLKVILPTVLLTMWALLDGVAYRNHALAAQAAALRASDGSAKQKDKGHGGAGISGYESIILWPIAEKKQIVAPIPIEDNLLAKGTKQPLVFRFDGDYWYFQPPDKRPGLRALRTHGTPLAVNIRANNSIPLVMEAHQRLGTPIPLARCGEIQIAIENRGQNAGAVALAVLLSDSSASGSPSVYLGQQSVVTSEPGQLPNLSASASSAASANEVLRFFIPAGERKIRRFDEITVMFLSDLGPFEVGPQIAIEQFSLIPR
jgi:hypothetical protein